MMGMPRCSRSVEQIPHDLLLAVDRHRGTRQRRHVDMKQRAVQREIRAAMDKPLLVQPAGNAQAVHQVDSDLFQDTGANTAFHVEAVTTFDDDDLDPLTLQQMRRNMPAGPAPIIATCVFIEGIFIDCVFIELSPIPLTGSVSVSTWRIRFSEVLHMCERNYYLDKSTDRTTQSSDTICRDTKLLFVWRTAPDRSGRIRACGDARRPLPS